MRMTGSRDVFRARAELDRDRELRDQITRARTDHVRAEDAVRRRVGEDLDAALDGTERLGPPVRLVRKHPLLVRRARALELVLRFTDARDFRGGVDDARDGIVVDV